MLKLISIIGLVIGFTFSVASANADQKNLKHHKSTTNFIKRAPSSAEYCGGCSEDASPGGMDSHVTYSSQTECENSNQCWEHNSGKHLKTQCSPGPCSE